MAESPEKKAVYFGSLTVEGVKCFKGKETLDLTDTDGKPAMLTVILGDNGTGKTTLLICLIGGTPFWTPVTNQKDVLNGVKGQIQPLRLHDSQFPKFEGRTRVEFIRVPENDLAGFMDFDTRQIEVESKPSSIFGAEDPDDFAIVDAVVGAYGARRHIGSGELVGSSARSLSNFEDDLLIDAEEYIARLIFAGNNGARKAKIVLDQLLRILMKIIPDFGRVEAKADENLNNYITVETSNGDFRLRDLSLGYQTMVGLVTDLFKNLSDRYPRTEDARNEPAVILIDEIDLHLHPSWQQRILNDLTTHFPKVQFIVTTHSPLVLQSAKKVNLAVLHATDNGVTIRNYKDTTFSGWSPEEILHDLMELDHTHSDIYGELMRKFKDAVIDDKYLEAKVLFDQLDKILHPNNVTRRLLRLDLASLTPPEIA